MKHRQPEGSGSPATLTDVDRRLALAFGGLYPMSRPLPVDEFTRLLENRRLS